MREPDIGAQMFFDKYPDAIQYICVFKETMYINTQYI